MIRYYSVNGQIVSASDASLKVNDLAILRGYGIFDYFLVREGVPLFLDDYVSRFFNSAQLMQLEIPFSASELKELIHELIDVNGAAEAGMRLVLTGGYAEDSYTPLQPNLLILEHPKPNMPAFENGAKLMLHNYQRELPEAKTINYLTGIRLRQEIKQQGALEVLYHNDGIMREAARSNFFLVKPDNTIVTPDAHILRGITRKNVLAIARERFQVEEREVRVEELQTAKEAFITGSLKAVVPIVQISEMSIGNGKVGEVTRQLERLLEERVKAYIESAKVEI